MIILGGPYIGNFEHEVMTFRPWLLWLFTRYDIDKMYVNTHKNRSFLYDFIPNENIMPVYEHISRDELGQNGYIHEQVDQRDFQSFVKNIKTQICELNDDCNKRDIITRNLSFVRSTPHYSIYNKTFSKIGNLDIENPYKDKIVFIPYLGEEPDLLKIKDFLKDLDFIIVGDKCSIFQNENVVLPMIDYYENGWKLILKIITDARAVVCPLSYWTTICNLQQVPVFSWGGNVGQHRPGGIYYFGNQKCIVVPLNDIDSIINMLEHFLEETEHEK